MKNKSLWKKNRSLQIMHFIMLIKLTTELNVELFFPMSEKQWNMSKYSHFVRKENKSFFFLCKTFNGIL